MVGRAHYLCCIPSSVACILNLFFFIYILACFVESLACDGSQHNEHSTLMGYIMGYLAMLTGHRSVVLTNMTKEHVTNFETWNHVKRFQVLVSIYLGTVGPFNKHFISQINTSVFTEVSIS